MERGNRENSGSDVPVQRENENEKTRERGMKDVDCLEYTAASPSRNME